MSNYIKCSFKGFIIGVDEPCGNIALYADDMYTMTDSEGNVGSYCVACAPQLIQKMFGYSIEQDELKRLEDRVGKLTLPHERSSTDAVQEYGPHNKQETIDELESLAPVLSVVGDLAYISQTVFDRTGMEEYPEEDRIILRSAQKEMEKKVDDMSPPPVIITEEDRKVVDSVGAFNTIEIMDNLSQAYQSKETLKAAAKQIRMAKRKRVR